MEDLQLAMIVARLYEADFENSSTCQGLLYEKVLGCNRDGSGYHCSRLHPDPFLRSIAYWIMKDYTQALDTLLERIPKEDDENPGQLVSGVLVGVTQRHPTKPLCSGHIHCLLCLKAFSCPSAFSKSTYVRCDGEIVQPGGVQFL